jgi:hypothetical protein
MITIHTIDSDGRCIECLTCTEDLQEAVALFNGHPLNPRLDVVGIVANKIEGSVATKLATRGHITALIAGDWDAVNYRQPKAEVKP